MLSIWQLASYPIICRPCPTIFQLFPTFFSVCAFHEKKLIARGSSVRSIQVSPAFPPSFPHAKRCRVVMGSLVRLEAMRL